MWITHFANQRSEVRRQCQHGAAHCLLSIYRSADTIHFQFRQLIHLFNCPIQSPVVSCNLLSWSCWEPAEHVRHYKVHFLPITFPFCLKKVTKWVFPLLDGAAKMLPFNWSNSLPLIYGHVVDKDRLSSATIRTLRGPSLSSLLYYCTLPQFIGGIELS